MCLCAFHSIFMPSMMCVWALLVLVPSPVSLRRLPLLFHTPPVLCAALHLQCRHLWGLKTLRTRTVRSIAPWRYTILSQVMSPTSLDDFHNSETSAMIFHDESGDIDTEPSYLWRGTRRWDHRKSAIFTTVHSGARRTSEPETSLSLSWRKFVCQLSPFPHTQVRWDPYANLVRTKTKTKSRNGKRKNQDSPWKTKRANSRWSQNRDPEARISSRFW